LVEHLDISIGDILDECSLSFLDVFDKIEFANKQNHFFVLLVLFFDKLFSFLSREQLVMSIYYIVDYKAWQSEVCRVSFFNPNYGRSLKNESIVGWIKP
jgi:hypothetical protein